MGDDIRVRKLARYFDDLDSNDDGLLDESDFAQAAERYLSALGIEPDSETGVELTEECLTLWQEYLRPIDTTGDGQLSRDQLAAAFGRMSEAQVAGQIDATADAYFRIMDADGDGVASEHEFLRLMTAAARLTEEDAGVAYARLDPVGVGHLTKEQFQRAAREFFFSEDPDAPGNLLFGKY
jgi:Ca2+-binding EF-hand superfamily protein